MQVGEGGESEEKNTIGTRVYAQLFCLPHIHHKRRSFGHQRVVSLTTALSSRWGSFLLLVVQATKTGDKNI